MRILCRKFFISRLGVKQTIGARIMLLLPDNDQRLHNFQQGIGIASIPESYTHNIKVDFTRESKEYVERLADAVKIFGYHVNLEKINIKNKFGHYTRRLVFNVNEFKYLVEIHMRLNDPNTKLFFLNVQLGKPVFNKQLYDMIDNFENINNDISQFLQNFFLDPISGKIIREPVLAGDNVIYDRDFIVEWIIKHSSYDSWRSPSSNEAIFDFDISPHLKTTIIIENLINSKSDREEKNEEKTSEVALSSINAMFNFHRESTRENDVERQQLLEKLKQQFRNQGLSADEIDELNLENTENKYLVDMLNPDLAIEAYHRI